MCLWCTVLAEYEVANKITFSAVYTVHGLLLPGSLSTEPMSVNFLTASEDFAHSNYYLKFLQQLYCSISIKQTQIFNKTLVSFIEWHV